MPEASPTTMPKDYEKSVSSASPDGAEEGDLIVMRKSEYRQKADGDACKELMLTNSRSVEKLIQDIAAEMKKTLAKRG